MNLTQKLTAISIMIVLSLTSISQSSAQNNDTTITISKSQLKMIEAMKLIANSYMDSIPESKIAEMGIQSLLGTLDPHTRYYSKEEAAKEQNKQSCQQIGMGMQCRIFRDTVIVVAVEQNSPAYRAGIRPGCKLDSIGKYVVSGRHLSQNDINRIMDAQTGDSTSLVMYQRKGTRYVMIGIDGASNGGIEAHYAPNDTSVYIKITSFCKETDHKFDMVLKSYPKKRLRNVIIDLRDNPGGLYPASINISNMFVGESVRTSKSVSRNTDKTYYPDHDGALINSRVYVLVNENSASASEVIASCLQDSDRGVVIGRRSFGKGLSQQIYTMSDGSMIKISNARLISPSGRCIQKDYEKVSKEYFSETAQRRLTGENLSASKMPSPTDTTAYTTLRKGRKMYAGIGVVPDVFVPEDTTTFPDRWQRWLDNDLLCDFAYFYTYVHRDEINKKYKTFKTFKSNFHVTMEIVEEFVEFCKKDPRSGKLPSDCVKELNSSRSQLKITHMITAIFAKTIFGQNEYHEIMNNTDPDYQAALRLIGNPSEYYKIL